MQDVRAGRVNPSDGITFCIVRRGESLPPLCPWLAPRADDFAAMLASDKIGLFVLRNEAAVGCAWASLSDHHDPRVREHYAVAPGEAYQYCWLLDPVERPRGTAMVFVRWSLGMMRALGIGRQFMVVDRENHASYRVMQHFGYRECGRLVRHRHLFRLRWTSVHPYDGTLGIAGPARRRRHAA